ncbi:MAG: DUF192 domain-containing protein [Patescibacteria group bacterium]
MKLYVILFAIAVIVMYSLYYRKNPLISKVRVGSHTFTVDVAVTALEKMQGLSGKDSLPPNHGRLFVYDHQEQYEFWMKGMKFPLDFIWIADHTVVNITENVPAPTGLMPAIVKPYVDVDKILEVTAGTITKSGIKVGDTVQFIDR